MNKLPFLPSDCFRLALNDLKKAENSSEYRIDMGQWFTKTPKVCLVCLVGAVIAFSLKDQTEIILEKALEEGRRDIFCIWPGDFRNLNGKYNWDRLHSINSLRTGEIELAYSFLIYKNKDSAKLFHEWRAQYPKWPKGQSYYSPNWQDSMEEIYRACVSLEEFLGLTK